MIDTQWRAKLGAIGEAAVARELQARGWLVTDLNAARRNEPNADLLAKNRELSVHVQVKAYNGYGWILGGGVSPSVCTGGPLFNKVTGGEFRCDYVICVTPAQPGDPRTIPARWRFFVMPVHVAERLFRINIDAYFNSPKADGTARVKKGTCRDWVGPGPLPSTIVPDHKQDYAPYEGNFELLEVATLTRVGKTAELAATIAARTPAPAQPMARSRCPRLDPEAIRSARRATIQVRRAWSTSRSAYPFGSSFTLRRRSRARFAAVPGYLQTSR